MTADHTLEQAFQDLERRIAAAREGLALGQALEVAELEAAIQALCARAGTCPADSREALMAGLLKLDGQLAELAEALRGRIAAGTPAEPPTQPAKAAAAYARPPRN